MADTNTLEPLPEPKIGMCFGDELYAAGIGGLPFSWDPFSGEFFGRENLTAEQDATLQQVIDAHDPSCAGTPWAR